MIFLSACMAVRAVAQCRLPTRNLDARIRQHSIHQSRLQNVDVFKQIDHKNSRIQLRTEHVEGRTEIKGSGHVTYVLSTKMNVIGLSRICQKADH
jgi:hypothetical protein